METVKLVIWDLDDTFWSGTLSEGPVKAIPENIELLKNLTDRGIVNSICSKNDYEKARTALEQMDVWEYFVFPSIDWTTKGGRLANIISDMNLRPVNCLFVDDNINNLREAEFAVPDIQTASPEDFREALRDEVFQGKDDPEHKRLRQYKILESKAKARETAGSNQEFLYQSNIRVTMLRADEADLSRVHEMIHRTNQLNFTKDRIAQEDVNLLFTDESVNSGVVRVRDRYGDHGIVGCYAVRDGRAVQFCFSCRILGMGVEQWVYAALGSPEIEIVGDVASRLEKDISPAWINQKTASPTTVSHGSEMPTTKGPDILFYGECQLRPIEAYVSARLSSIRFGKLDISPCVFNLGVLMRSPESAIHKILDNVSVFNSQYSFDWDFKAGRFEYLITSLNNWHTWKIHTSRKDGSYFFTGCALTEENASRSILDEYDERPLTLEDAEQELNALCASVKPGVKIVLLTCAEVEFTSRGKDQGYYNRKRLNVLEEKVAAENQNLILLDIRKYAVSQMDFNDSSPNHYNRSIGYMLSKEFLQIADQNSSSACTALPDNTVYATHKFTTGGQNMVTTFTSAVYILNGVLRVVIKSDADCPYMFRYALEHNRYVKAQTEILQDAEFQIPIKSVGVYRVHVSVCLDGKEAFQFQTGIIRYNLENIIQYINPNADGYENFKASADEMILETQAHQNFEKYLISQVMQLTTHGVSLSEFFLSKGIQEISLFANRSMAEILLPVLTASNISIRHLYVGDYIPNYVPDSDDKALIPRAPDNMILSDKDVLLYADSSRNFNFFHPVFARSGAKVFLLREVLSTLMTKRFFMDRICRKNHAPKILALRTANLNGLRGFPARFFTPNERILVSDIKNETMALNAVRKGGENLPPQLRAIPKEILEKTLVKPDFYRKPNCSYFVMRDTRSPYVNIENGFRRTVGTPDEGIGNIYLFGNAMAFGAGCTDEETIASQLQKMIDLPFRVHNRANYWTMEDHNHAIRLFDDMDFEENDIAVFLIHCLAEPGKAVDQRGWLDWNYMTEPVIRLDALPIFKKLNRPDYFLHPLAVNAECNYELAKIIRDAIWKTIRFTL